MKTVKTAISIPEDLLQAVKEYAGEKPFSTTVCNLIRKALNQDGREVQPDVIPGITSYDQGALTRVWDQIVEIQGNEKATINDLDKIDGKISDLIQRVDDLGQWKAELSERFEALAAFAADEYQTRMDNPDLPGYVPDPLISMFIPTEGNPNPKDSITKVQLEVIPENDKVHLDDETRRDCIQKVNELKEAGMGIMKIAELLGMKSHSQLSKMMNPVSYPKIGLTRHQIDTLLSL